MSSVHERVSRRCEQGIGQGRSGTVRSRSLTVRVTQCTRVVGYVSLAFPWLP